MHWTPNVRERKVSRWCDSKHSDLNLKTNKFCIYSNNTKKKCTLRSGIGHAVKLEVWGIHALNGIAKSATAHLRGHAHGDDPDKWENKCVVRIGVGIRTLHTKHEKSTESNST